jgi:hypothetical protein
VVKILQVKKGTLAKQKPVRFGQTISGSFHDAAQLVGRVTSKTKVQRKFAPDPNGYNKLSTKTTATFSPVAEQFTNNPNPKYDPSRAPGSVAVKAKSRDAEKPGKSSRGHQKVITLGRQYFQGGKTLKRR